MEYYGYGCGGRLCFPKMAATMSSILHTLLGCDFDLPHHKVESNSPSLDLGVATVTPLYPVKWDRSNAAGFLRLGRKKCDSFCLGFLEPSFSGCTLLEWSLFELPFDLYFPLTWARRLLWAQCLRVLLLWNTFSGILEDPSGAWDWLELAVLSGQEDSGWTESCMDPIPVSPFLCAMYGVDQKTIGIVPVELSRRSVAGPSF